MKRGLVLAGGYVVGVAWELGVMRGLQDVDADLLAKLIAADVVVGTSAGSTVAAQITSGTGVDALYAAQLSEASVEIDVDVDMRELMARFAKVAETAASATDFRRRIGALALATHTTVDETTYRASRAARLSVHTWPARDVRLVSVDTAADSRLNSFTSSSMACSGNRRLDAMQLLAPRGGHRDSATATRCTCEKVRFGRRPAAPGRSTRRAVNWSGTIRSLFH